MGCTLVIKHNYGNLTTAHQTSSLALGESVLDLPQLLERGDSLVDELPGLDGPDAGDARQQPDRHARVVATDLLQLPKLSCKRAIFKA